MKTQNDSLKLELIKAYEQLEKERISQKFQNQKKGLKSNA